MYHDFNYKLTLATSLRAQWMLDDVLLEDQNLDFSRNFMPESLARTGAITSLDADEQRVLNQISAHQYLSIFGIVEEFILPFLIDHSRTALHDDDDWRVRALLNFAGEEAKHIHLFKRFHAAFVRGFPVECAVIGPSEAIGAEVLRHDPLAVGLVILMIEWMTQQHYLGSIRDDTDLDTWRWPALRGRDSRGQRGCRRRLGLRARGGHGGRDGRQHEEGSTHISRIVCARATLADGVRRFGRG